MENSLFRNAEFSRPLNAVAAGTTTQNGSSVNLEDATGVVFVALLGTITAGAVTSLKAQQSSDDGNSDDWTDIEGSAVTIADDQDNKVAILEVLNPTKKYVRPVLVRGTQNAVIDGVIAIKLNPRKAPPTQPATVMAASKTIYGPKEGTA